VGPRAVLDTVVKRNIPSPHRESNPRTPIQPATQRSNIMLLFYRYDSNSGLEIINDVPRQRRVDKCSQRKKSLRSFT
jgi:hypothetical protein